jgi:hypothetical protein
MSLRRRFAPALRPDARNGGFQADRFESGAKAIIKMPLAVVRQRHFLRAGFTG